MGSSLKTAVFHLTHTDGLLVMLGDMPLISPEVINQVVAAFNDDLGDIVVPRFGKRNGHPVLFGSTLFSRLFMLPAGKSPRFIIEQHDKKSHLLEVADESILMDIDTPEAYEIARPR